MSNVVKLDPAYFPNPSLDRSLSGAKVYVGTIDLDPVVEANQIQLQILKEDGTLIDVTQPQTMSSGGVVLYNGSPATLVVDGSHSLKVLSSTDEQIYYIPKNIGSGSAAADDAAASAVEAAASAVESSDSATESAWYASSASGFADAAETSASDAQIAAGNAVGSANLAETSRINAETAETNAETAETNAAASAAAAAAYDPNWDSWISIIISDAWLSGTLYYRRSRDSKNLQTKGDLLIATTIPAISGTNITTLPAGYRPDEVKVSAGFTFSGNQYIPTGYTFYPSGLFNVVGYVDLLPGQTLRVQQNFVLI